MLQIQNIYKEYVTGDLRQTALKGVSLNLRDNEFVAILGPSGSGKTTLLNIIGGLDRYDSGDLVINGISTKKYKDRDWDSYRNHTIGFVFQSYNLIPHQSVLANVELALTISGVSRSERRSRAKEALIRVGLENHMNKRPNQLSGGQMQRVAIARALINNPDILLADEPTGALDTETSIQVMELLKEVAKDRLVIMVTHNPELAERYATRIVRLKDGEVTDDSDSYSIDETNLAPAEHKNMGKAYMNFRTALSLSFNNLRTKKGRTLLTAFAGSIGIIGISLILALSSGVDTYIEDIQRETMTSYPITIDAQTLDLSSIMEEAAAGHIEKEADHSLDGVYADSAALEMANQITTSVTENNLTEFKKYLDDEESEIHQYLGENGVIYSYDVPFSVYARNEEGEIQDTADNGMGNTEDMYASSDMSQEVQQGMMNTMSSWMDTAGGSAMYRNDIFDEMLPGTDGQLVSQVTKDSYDVVAGEYPQKYDEVVLVLDEKNEISTTMLYSLGLIPEEDYSAMIEAINNGEEFESKEYSWSYDELLGRNFWLVPACDYYEDNGDGTWNYIGDDPIKREQLAENGITLTVSGIIRPKEDTDTASISGAVGYTNALTDYLIDYAGKSPVVLAQQNSPEVNILTGMEFEPGTDEEKIEDARIYIQKLGISGKAALWKDMANVMYAGDEAAYQQMSVMDEEQLAAMMDQYMMNPDDEVLLSVYDNYISAGSYEENMTAFGFVSREAPSSINIYADTFEDKDRIAECITNYNEKTEAENQITYTDFVAMMTSSITTIIDVISYVLIAFVSVSLVVSSIMIGIITYVSVLERTKEIGILRALGASKHNISQVFNAETVIIGLCAGVLGVGIAALLTIPINAVIHNLIGNSDVNAYIPAVSAVTLIILSTVLTLIGGLIPAKKAARKDPVKALRTE